MYFEVYLDSMFIVSFVLHFYLLLLLRRTLQTKGGTGRIILGAVVGGMGALLPFFMGGSPWFRLIFSTVLSTALMLLVAFRISGLKTFFLLWERLLLCSLLLSGGFLFLFQMLPFAQGVVVSFLGVLGMGGVLCLFLGAGCKRMLEKKTDCRVVLQHNGDAVVIRALVDTGNGLTEPISGKPVSVVEESVLKGLFQEGLPPGRVIPYRAIGTEHGYLMGYLMPEIRVRIQGVEQICREVYIAATPDKLQGNGRNDIKMLVNPRMLQQNEY